MGAQQRVLRGGQAGEGLAGFHVQLQRQPLQQKQTCSGALFECSNNNGVRAAPTRLPANTAFTPKWPQDHSNKHRSKRYGTPCTPCKLLPWWWEGMAGERHTRQGDITLHVSRKWLAHN
jgi:hypothetical protein